MKNAFKKIDLFLLTFVLIVALSLRLYKINIPLADFHSWRQVDTASVAANFVKNGFDLMHPTFHDLSNVPSGLDNPNGYRMVEFPLYNASFAFLYKLMPSIPLEVWGRIVTIFFSLVIISIIYYLVLKEANRTAAFFAGLIYGIMPFIVFFSRVVLPDTSALAFVFIAIFFLYKGENKPITYILSLLFFATSLLIKPMSIFYGAALFYVFFKNHKLSNLKRIPLYIYFIFGAIPLLYWRNYIKSYPEGIPSSDWLITSVNTYQGLQNIFFKPAFFRWIFFERINNLILGGYLTGLFVVGAALKQKKYLLHSILFSAFAYLLVFQGGNVQHEYYQTFIFPALAIFVGLGIGHIVSGAKEFFHPIVTYTLIFTVISFSWFFSYYKVRDYYNYSTDLVQIAKIINSLTLPDDKIVADQTGDTTLLYLAQRTGSASVFKDPLELKRLGYAYLTTSNEGMIEQMTRENFKLVFKNDKLSIFKL